MLTGNLRLVVEIKLTTAGLDTYLDLRIGGFESDARDSFDLPAVVERDPDDGFSVRYIAVRRTG